MAIRKIDYIIGEENGVLKKKRVQDKELLSNLQHYVENKDILILKCGKSFWDVTDAPEVFEMGESWDPESMNGTDKKQMELPEPPKPVFENVEEKRENPMMALYHRTDEFEEEEGEEAEKLERKTFYFRAKDVEAITLLRFHLRIDGSALIRDAVERGLRAIAEEIGFGDVYAMAEENIAKGAHITTKRKYVKKKIDS